MGDSTQANKELSNTDSPYFLYSSDIPGVSIVTQNPTGENYATLSRAIRMTLLAKNKYGFIDGTIEKPSSSDPKASQWERWNKMVYSWILNSVHNDITNSVMYAETAQEVWLELSDRFSQQNAPRIFQLSRAIATHEQGTCTMGRTLFL
ncbi:uncharacterized protein A4U43_C10F12800 [Asparagus officinalis]|uniref:Retrotransposon Copia-like N-terminal domain-containing protein n=1 Tax=Asparagus officinalis TaxID=4686 RepID=A0A5P1E5P7_ASPOF|nr:uncharacterized protein A4U43_C10F12800 [Asparagus officinalis]